MAGKKSSRESNSKRGDLDSRGEELQTDVSTTDAVGMHIVELLQEDGRAPFAKIAEQVGVSEGTVRNRVRQMLDDNIISINADALPAAFGFNWNAITFLKLSGGVDIDALAEGFTDIEEVYYVVMLSGQYDLGIATFHRSSEEFRQFLATHCYSNPNIAAVDANVNLKVYKIRTKWRFGQGR